MSGENVRLVTARFELQESYLVVPTRGGDRAREWQLRILDEQGNPVATIGRDSPETMHTGEDWWIAVDAWRGREARVEVTVQREDAAQVVSIEWPLGAAHRHAVQRSDWPGRRNYVRFGVAVLVVAVLLWLPGVACSAWWRGDLPRAAWFWPLPGLLLLAATGLVLWQTEAASSGVIARGYLGFHALLALALLVWPPRPEAPTGEAKDTLTAYSALATGVVMLSAVPWPMAHEGFPASSLQSRLVLSAGDHAIPYVTAAYFAAGYDGKEESERYFSRDWSVASRGPMPSLAIVTLFNALGVAPPAQLGQSLSAYPAADDAFFVARIFGVLSNALVLLGAVRLLSALGVREAGARKTLLLWVGLAPVVLSNTIFVWPKLLAVFFVLLAAADIVERRRPFGIGLWCALAWLSHPVGALMAPTLALLYLHLEWRQPSGERQEHGVVGRAILVIAGGAILLVPWLTYKLWLGAPDAFLSYPLGDGHGFARATDAGSWWQNRWSNFSITLIPGVYLWSQYGQEWFGAPVGGAIRWVMHSAKSLPGSVGLVMLPAVVAAFGTRSGPLALRLTKAWLVIFALVLMIG
ncbi:MAG TPA: hypothetical protein VHF69_08655, partial [Candidatus Synoicihabitans sp.]|nr:hypothetical protein [Candidatus Synoicihabitans sp.]